MPRRSRRRELPLSKKSKKISFHQFISSLPRPFPDPQAERHINLYFQYTHLKHKLEKWLQPEKVFYNTRGYPIPNIADAERLSSFALALVSTPTYSENDGCHVDDRNLYWDSPYILMYRTNVNNFQRDCIHPGKCHEFLLGHRWFSYKPLTDDMLPNKNTSHSLAVMDDSLIPDDRVLWSELLSAVKLSRDQLAQRFWPDHYIFIRPDIKALANTENKIHRCSSSVFYDGGGRILQMHVENEQIHVRVSRLLNLVSLDESVPADGLVVAQWLLAKPIGNTKFYDTRALLYQRGGSLSKSRSWYGFDVVWRRISVRSRAVEKIVHSG